MCPSPTKTDKAVFQKTHWTLRKLIAAILSKAPIFSFVTVELLQFQRNQRVFEKQHWVLGNQDSQSTQIAVVQLFCTPSCCQFLTSLLSPEWKELDQYWIRTFFLFSLRSYLLCTQIEGCCAVLVPSRCFAVTVTVTYWHNRKVPGFVGPTTRLLLYHPPLCLAWNIFSVLSPKDLYDNIIHECILLLIKCLFIKEMKVMLLLHCAV